MATKKTENAGPVEARVLMSGQYGPIDSVVLVDAELANADPSLDPDPAAVAYAKSLAVPAAQE